MTDEEVVSIIADALGQLARACRSLITYTRPEVPVPRARQFYIADSTVWPGNDRFNLVIYVPDMSDVVIHRQKEPAPRDWWSMTELEGSKWQRTRAAKAICGMCRWQPKLMLRALRRIEAAARWCEARAAGRKRAAKEIRRQQKAAAEKMESVVALRKMANL